MSREAVFNCAAYQARALDWGSVPDWVVALTAIITALYAANQLRLLRISREDAVEAQRAATDQHKQYLRIEQGFQLMEIDNQYEGVLQPSRKALLALRRQIQNNLPSGAQRNEISEQVSVYLNGLRCKSIAEGWPWSARARARAVDEYFCLTQLPNYIETMGVLVEEGLVDEGMVIRLYDGMIERVIGDVLPHIHWRRTEDRNPNYLIFAERLYKKAADHMEKSAAEAAI